MGKSTFVMVARQQPGAIVYTGQARGSVQCDLRCKTGVQSDLLEVQVSTVTLPAGGVQVCSDLL